MDNDTQSGLRTHVFLDLCIRAFLGLVLVFWSGVILYVVGIQLIVKWNDVSGGYGVGSSDSYGSTSLSGGGSCNVAVIPLSGELFVTTADADTNGGSAAHDIVASISSAESDDSIKGIVLQINSPGGSPVGGEMIADALRGAKKPTVALIQDMGDSAAYLAASGASTIIASAMSDVGDIGVTSSYIDYSGSDLKAGNTFVQLSAGKYKDAGNPDKPLTAEEKKLFQANIDDVYETFVSIVARNRNLPIDTVRTLADGSPMTGNKGLEKHLVDTLGNMDTARDWFAQKFGKDDEPVLCQ
jgi:protease-4